MLSDMSVSMQRNMQKSMHKRRPIVTGITYQYPSLVVPSVPTTWATDATSHPVTLATSGTIAAGELLILGVALDGNQTLAVPAGWIEWFSTASSGGRGYMYAKEADGTEGGTVIDFTTGAAEGGGCRLWRLKNWGGILADHAKFASAVVSYKTIGYASPSLTPAFGRAEAYWITALLFSLTTNTTSGPLGWSGYQQSGDIGSAGGMIAIAHKTQKVTSDAPGQFGFASSAATMVGVTIAVRGSPLALPFSPESYGAVGNDIADDTAAFQAMHTAILSAQSADPDVPIVINLTAGKVYRYTWCRWLWGIRRVTVEGNGASIRNTNASGTAVLEVALHTNRDSFNLSDYNTMVWENNLGYLIDTALANATSVTLKTPADASNFSVGKWVCVASFSQQVGGWPPNPRYCDWAKVADISGGTITIDRVLKYNHRDDWPTRGDPDEISVAKIIAAEREIPWTETGKLRNLTALANPNAGGYWGEVVQIEGFNTYECENVNFLRWTAGQGRSITLRNSSLPISEQDKMLNFVRMENCSPCTFQIASGVDRVEVVDSYLPNGNWFCGRELFVDNCVFDGAMTSWNTLYTDTFTPVYKIEVVNSTFNGVGNGNWPVPTDAAPIYITIGQDSVALDGTDVVVSADSIPVWGSFQNYFGLMNRIYDGDHLILQDSTLAYKGYGQVVSVRSNGGAFTARIVVNWSTPPVVGDRIKQFAVEFFQAVNSTLNNVDSSWTYNGIANYEWNGNLRQSQPWFP